MKRSFYFNEMKRKNSHCFLFRMDFNFLIETRISTIVSHLAAKSTCLGGITPGKLLETYYHPKTELSEHPTITT